ncbi:2-oxo-tetronate isomerase [Mesorhizobium xinjiangense]|uniref:2-oxo-tetronate isomerase n=1 Tax=Mesorhizobium xinjiangense TaxID=2678685 RepID=UPI0012EE0042|nr:2-oxo-tetronate isomerase [Mesorhizobium xinjiangense]
MPRLAANLTTMFREAPFLDRFALAAEAGFEAVEFQFPYEFEVDEVAAALARHRLELALFNLPAGDWAAGERGLAILPDRRSAFEASVDMALSWAERLGCRKLHCMAGIVPEGVGRASLEETYLANLRFAADAAAAHGISILIEPINRFDMPGYFLASMDEAARIQDKVGADNLHLQYDFYHQSRTGGELLATFERFAGRIAHVQIAGNPGRQEPDLGEVNYEFLLTALDDAGYQGLVGCEYRPAGKTQDGLGWAAAWLDGQG